VSRAKGFIAVPLSAQAMSGKSPTAAISRRFFGNSRVMGAAICIGSATRVILPLAMMGERRATLFHGRKTQKVVKDSVVQLVTVLTVLLGSILVNVVSAL